MGDSQWLADKLRWILAVVFLAAWIYGSIVVSMQAVVLLAVDETSDTQLWLGFFAFVFCVASCLYIPTAAVRMYRWLHYYFVVKRENLYSHWYDNNKREVASISNSVLSQLKEMQGRDSFGNKQELIEFSAPRQAKYAFQQAFAYFSVEVKQVRLENKKLRVSSSSSSTINARSEFSKCKFKKTEFEVKMTLDRRDVTLTFAAPIEVDVLCEILQEGIKRLE